MRRKKKPDTKKKLERVRKAVFTNEIVMRPKDTPKDEIVYVRLRKDDVKQLDFFRKKLKINTRSEMVRDFVVKAMNAVKIKSMGKYC